jgi:hypothetical protein
MLCHSGARLARMLPIFRMNLSLIGQVKIGLMHRGRHL